jgi:hypothetical protein
LKPLRNSLKAQNRPLLVQSSATLAVIAILVAFFTASGVRWSIVDTQRKKAAKSGGSELRIVNRQQLQAAAPMRDSEAFQGELGRLAEALRAARALPRGPGGKPLAPRACWNPKRRDAPHGGHAWLATTLRPRRRCPSARNCATECLACFLE